ncbi:MAG: hypothetical protein JWN83_2891 [Chitinophagaceae bacterium]|nr:hypothetical protein [Chitinophagaceae bacterium]
MHRFFICNQEEIDFKLQSLIKTRTSEDGWTNYYIDKSSNEEWILTRFNSEYHGGGEPVLKRLPLPTIEQLINIALTSSDKNDIIGSAHELLEREKYNKDDFRNILIERLLLIDTSRLTGFEKERLKIIINDSALHDSINRRDIVGKHFTEIESDANYYRTVSQKAKGILNDIEKYSS